LNERRGRAKKTPERRGRKETEELAELAELRGDSRQRVMSHIPTDCGHLSKK
jgi:hypothetical protein